MGVRYTIIAANMEAVSWSKSCTVVRVEFELAEGEELATGRQSEASSLEVAVLARIGLSSRRFGCGGQGAFSFVDTFQYGEANSCLLL